MKCAFSFLVLLGFKLHFSFLRDFFRFFKVSYSFEKNDSIVSFQLLFISKRKNCINDASPLKEKFAFLYIMENKNIFLLFLKCFPLIFSEEQAYCILCSYKCSNFPLKKKPFIFIHYPFLVKNIPSK
jgi:hypothetical protein